jgi:hypothetical protein
MSLISTNYRRLLALLLPTVLLCSCMACVVICSEIAGHDDAENNVCIKSNGAGNECVELSGISESCSITTTHIIFQKGQFDYAPALVNSKINYLSQQKVKFVSLFIPDSNINQNSPPQLLVPLYLQFSNFRI